MRQFIIQNWKWVVAAGIIAMVYLDGQKGIAERDAIIDSIENDQEEQKEKISKEIDSIYKLLDNYKENKSILDNRVKGLEELLKNIESEREHSFNSIPDYPDHKLDSILSNYRRPRYK